MSWLSKVFSRLFNKNIVTSEKEKESQLKWDREKQQRLSEIASNLKEWLVELLKDKKELAFSWECGNDEATMSFTDYAEWDSNNFEDLEYFLIEKLSIPGHGEFEMKGKGVVYISGDLVKASYQSSIKAVIDYDAEAEKEIFSEAEEDNGDKVLFAI